MEQQTLIVLALFTMLVIKHFICDFPMQVPFMYKNKGNWRHLGGYVHAGVHALGTVYCTIFFVGLKYSLILALVDFVIHYITDWSKVNVTTKFGLTATNSEAFWILLGVDQMIHYLTYVLIVYMVITNHA